MPKQIETAQSFQHFVFALNSYMRSQGFNFVQTPTLVRSPGLEPHLIPFETEFVFGKLSQKYYLPYSPEYGLKKALSQGVHNPFEIRSCFRNSELSLTHRSEFTLLEFYEVGVGFYEFQQRILGLLRWCENHFRGKASAKAQSILIPEWCKNNGFDLKANSNVEELRQWARTKSWSLPKDWNFSDSFNWIYVEKIEKSLNQDQFVFLIEYPPALAALAQIGASGFAQRFEVYYKGLELGNAYQELTNAEEQQARFASEIDQISELGRAAPPIDEVFVQSLKSGLPESCGIAIGVERLFMAFNNVQSINDLYLEF